MRVLVFSGTTEGKDICLYMAEKGISVTVCVATSYGKEVMPENESIIIKQGRMDIDEIEVLAKDFDFVIDATHPYAEIVTKNIKQACKNCGKEYIRLLRAEEETDYSNIIWFDCIKDIADYVSKTDGNVFLTTGSKECDAFRETDRKRIVLRALPTEEVIKKTENMGFKRVIYENPPFDEETNLRHFSESIDFVVTKSSGKSGGFGEKIKACQRLGIKVLAVKRPKEDGLTAEEVKKLINGRVYKKFPLFVDLSDKKVLVVGGGNIALRRIEILLKYGADITVVTKEFGAEELKKRVHLIQKQFEPEDIKDDYFIVISATDSRQTNKAVGTICREKGILASIADCTEECGFFFPSVVMTDNLSIGIVSDGKKHRLVKETRKKIGRLFCGE